ncbi:MAG: transketolase [Candidatus Omnitrophica bacterium]|nr:transketolase [Candidatus Omnitrophota bacterium]
MKTVVCKTGTQTIAALKEKARSVRKETIRIHGLSPEIRLASSLSNIEVLTVLYYGGILRFDAKNPCWEKRDRFIMSKGHGGVSLYPILADLGFFRKDELNKVCSKDSFLGAIPDCIVPGFETTNGSLGHGLGVACGMAVALRIKKIPSRVFVMVGDGELYEGAVWEAVMFAAHHKLDNVVLIVDNNTKCMLDYCRKVLDLEPLADKFTVFKWETRSVDGHDIEEILSVMRELLEKPTGRPKVLIANTIKGKGVPKLEADPLCHIRSLTHDEIERIIKEI